MQDSIYVHPATFTLFMRAPAEVRFQEIGGPTPAVIVCDTENAWVYSPPLNRYRTQPASESTLCSQIVGNWKSLASTLKSPVLAGRRTVEIGGRTTDCELVRGKSEATPPLSGDIKRELCIDKSTNLIVSERDEYKGSSRSYTYSKIERDIDMAPDIFVLKLPTGSEPTPYHLPLPERLGSLSMPREPGIAVPRIASKQDPVYDEASRRARIEGTVVLYIVIDSNGVPSEIDVFRHLSPGLDASAIEAVRHWRFTPATKNNQPIALGSMIEVNFRLR
jgi:periplasmic protein TonB